MGQGRMADWSQKELFDRRGTDPYMHKLMPSITLNLHGY